MRWLTKHICLWFFHNLDMLQIVSAWNLLILVKDREAWQYHVCVLFPELMQSQNLHYTPRVRKSKNVPVNKIFHAKTVRCKSVILEILYFMSLDCLESLQNIRTVFGLPIYHGFSDSVHTPPLRGHVQFVILWWHGLLKDIWMGQQLVCFCRLTKKRKRIWEEWNFESWKYFVRV